MKEIEGCCPINREEIAHIFDSVFFKSLGEPVRCEIIKYLIINGPKDVTEIADKFSQHRTVISRHLKIMEQAGVLQKKKISRRVLYQLNGKHILKQFEQIVTLCKKAIPFCCPDEVC